MVLGCRTVSVNEDAHSSTASTRSAASGSRCSLQDGVSSPWVAPSEKDRKRATSLESWLHNSRDKSDADKETRRAIRRAKRKAFFRKIFFLPPTLEEEEATLQQSPPTPPPSSKAGIVDPTDDDMPADEGSFYKLNLTSMASILNQYKSDCMSENGDDEGESETEKEDYDVSDLDSNTDMSEISVFDLEEETDDEGDAVDELNERDEDDGYALVMIPETELIDEDRGVQDVVREMPSSFYVMPPVRVPMEYTLQDRRGGTLVSGRHVLFTSAAFKRKQRQMLYHMRSIPEDEQYIVPQVRDDDDDSENDDLNTSGVYALQNEWI